MSQLEYSTSINGYLFGTWCNEEGLLPDDIRNVVANTRICPFCNERTVLAFAASVELCKDTYEYDTLVFECHGCGWWFKYHDNFIDLHYEIGILKAFGDTVSDKSLSEISSEIFDLSKGVRNITPKKLELVVSDAIRGIYDCKVKHIGQRGDGEVDILVLDGDCPIAIQVKHRKSPDSIETVDYVRKFLGGILIRNFKRGVFVTLANRFSKGAFAEANLAEKNGYITSIDLVSCKKLLSLMKISIMKKKRRPWASLLTEKEWHYATKIDHLNMRNGRSRAVFREQVNNYRTYLQENGLIDTPKEFPPDFGEPKETL